MACQDHRTEQPCLAMGLALYGSVYILPVYLGQIQGYDAQQIGEVVMWMGLPQLLVFPLVPILMKRIDTRILLRGNARDQPAISAAMNASSQPAYLRLPFRLAFSVTSARARF